MVDVDGDVENAYSDNTAGYQQRSYLIPERRSGAIKVGERERVER